MRTLLVDDERLARSELRRLLKAHPQLEIVGEAVDAGDARAKIKELKPEILFLDIQMPGENGFELLESLDVAPQVIFTTAYDDYAVRAFEVSALDYLMKPIDPARLESALAKLSNALNPVAPEAALINTARLRGDEKVFVREGDRCWFVEVKSIRLLESEGNYTRLHFDNVKPSLFRSLNAMEERLDPCMFFRANRSQLINLTWIEKIEPWFSGGLVVTLHGSARVELSRRQAQEFRERMSL
ncbi:MAG TPA: LytTR family DNA-binding domain-containing protein [Opitutaceae bacterium]|nr:LytTR family DNA-binding domain-containing protein [Opitutaceae bacterium]